MIDMKVAYYNVSCDITRHK